MKHEDPDPRDVDAGAARRLRVAADRVDVAAERRPRGDEVQKTMRAARMISADERHAARVVADRNGDEDEPP